MATYLVRYIYRKYKKRQAANGQPEDSTGPSQSAQPYSEAPLSAGNNVAATPASAQTQKEDISPDTRNTKSSLKWKLTLMVALLIPVFLEMLDYTVVATAQPHIASTFNRLDLQSYIGTAYVLSSTVFLPVFASAADIYGRHPALQLSLLIFFVGSAISTGAVNMTMMLIGRGIAGVGGAGLLTVVRTILADTRSLDDNNWQQSIVFVLFAIGFSVGPVIGGYLLSVSFRWIFAINLPCCVVAMALIFLLLRNKVKVGQPSQRLPTSSADPSAEPLPETVIDKFLRMDWIGALIFITGGILFLLALNWGSTGVWKDGKVIACFVVGGLLMIAFILWEYVLERQLTSSVPPSARVFATEPLIPLEVFRSYDVCAVQYASFISGMIMLVMFYFVAIFMTIVLGLSPGQAGVQLVYFAPGMGGGAWIAINAILFLRQPRYPIVIGSIILVVSLGLIQMAMQEDNQSQINGFMVMAGAGVGLTGGPLAIQARFSQADNRVSAVTGLTLFFRSLGGTVGLAQCAAVLSAKVTAFLTSAGKSGELSASYIVALAHANSQLMSIQSIDTLPQDVQELIRNAYRNGTRWAFISLIPWCSLAVFLTLFLSKIPDSDRLRKQSQKDKEKEKEEEVAVKGDTGNGEAEKEVGKAESSGEAPSALD